MRILRGSSLELHELEEEHLPLLLAWRNSEDFMGSCSTRRNSVSLDEFQNELHRDFERDRHLQFLISRRHEYIGTIYSYNLNSTDEHAFITVFLVPHWRNKGCGVAALALSMEFLFRELGLYKLYADVYAYNSHSLQALIAGGFREEGRFQGHRIYNGERHDLVRLAFFRTQLTDSAHVLKRLTGRDLSGWI